MPLRDAGNYYLVDESMKRDAERYRWLREKHPEAFNAELDDLIDKENKPCEPSSSS